MSLLVLAYGVMLLSVPALSARIHLGPAARVLTACVSAVAGIWVLGLGTVLTATPLVLWWHDAGEATSLGLAHVSPGGPLAWVAGGALGGLGASWTAGALWRSVATRRRASLPRWAADSFGHDEHAGAEVRVAPSARPIAFAVPGRDRHVVISQAMTRLLTEAELGAVLAHEGAHLRLHHDRYLLVLATYEKLWGWLPGVGAVVTGHRRAIEQWADTEATARRDVDEHALPRALHTLATHDQCLNERLEQPRRSSRIQLAGLSLIIAALTTAAGYLATHTVSDVAAAVTTLH